MRQIAAIATLLFALAVPLASPAAAQTEIEVTTPADGYYIPGSPTPIFVTLRADGARSGTIRILFEGQTVASQSFELPGGSTKQFVIVAPTPFWFASGSVVIEANDQNPVTRRLDLVASRSEELVGVLPALATNLPATADLSVDVGQARLFEVDPATLDLGPDLLGTFNYLVATPGDLAALGPPALDTVDSWVRNGGRLVIDAPAGTQTALPTVVGPDSLNQLGLGSVAFTGSAIASSGFDRVLSPTASRSPEDVPWGGWFGGGMPAAVVLAADAGVRVPQIGSLVVFLLGYVVVAGPLTFLLVRRRNREPLLWVLVPLLALVATGGVWLFGKQLRDNVTAAHGTLVVDLPSGQAVSTQVLVSSPNGGRSGIKLQPNWRPATPGFDETFNEFGFGAPTTVAGAVQNGNQLETDLSPGGISVVRAEASFSSEISQPAWNLDVRLVDNSLVGTITNLTSYKLERVSVSSGGALQRIGSIEPGAVAEVSLADPGRLPIQGDPLLESFFNEDFNRPNSVVNAAVVSQWIADHPSVRDPGNVLVLGWTREAPGPLVTTSGQTVEAGRTGFLAIAAIGNQESKVSAATNRKVVLRGFDGTRVTDQGRGGRGEEEFPLTLQIHPGATVSATDRLVIEVPRFVSALDLWSGEEWLPAGMADLPDEASLFEVPPEARNDGFVYVRFVLGNGWWGARDPLPSLRLAGAEETVLTLPLTVDEPADA